MLKLKEDKLGVTINLTGSEIQRILTVMIDFHRDNDTNARYRSEKQTITRFIRMLKEADDNRAELLLNHTRR